MEEKRMQRVVKILMSIADPSFLIGNCKLYCKKRINTTKPPPALGIKDLYHGKNNRQNKKTKITSRYRHISMNPTNLVLCELIIRKPNDMLI